MQAPELVSIKMESTVPNQGGRPGQKQQGCGLYREVCCLFSSQTSRQVVCCSHGEGEQPAEKQGSTDSWCRLHTGTTYGA